MLLLSSAEKDSFRNTISMSNGLDLEHSVSPDLSPNCLQILSAEDKGHRQQGKS